MTSQQPHARPEQQDNRLPVWGEQPGLEVDSDQKHDFSDKQAVPHVHRTSEYEDDGSGINSSQKTTRNPFGLSPLVFGLLIALVTAAVVGGAVGGGVGRQIKSSSVDSASVSTTTVFVTNAATASAASHTVSSSTYTDYTPALPAQILSVPLDCPNLNSQTRTTAEGDKFIFDCGVDYIGNDLAALIAYRLEDCCTACSAYNYQQQREGLDQTCQAFTFNANMSFAFSNEVPPGGPNCWLKSKSDIGTPYTDSGHLVVGGQLAS